MKKLIAVWIAVALSAGACVWQAQYTHEQDSYELACAALDEGACTDLAAPIVVISGVPLIIGAYGLYIKDESYVYVLPQAEMDKLSIENWVTRFPTVAEVTFHETIHYILDHGENPPSRCESEAIVRDLTAKQFNFIEDGSWRARYGCGLPRA